MMQPFRFFAARGQFISIKEDFACTYVEQFMYQNSFGIECPCRIAFTESHSAFLFLYVLICLIHKIIKYIVN